MTNAAYTTLKLRSLPQDTAAADGLYEFDARANDDADGDKKIDFFEARITDDKKKVDPSHLLGLQNGGKDNKSQRFGHSRFFVDDAGSLWQMNAFLGETADKKHAHEYWFSYEHADGTVIDANLLDGNEFVAPEDIGRAFVNKDKNPEFTNFIAAIAKAYAPLWDSVLSHLSGQQLAAADINSDMLATILADPTKSVKDVLAQVFKPAAIVSYQNEIELLDLYQRYLVQAQTLSKENATAYALPENAAPKDLKTLLPSGVTPGTATPAPKEPPVPVEVPPPSATASTEPLVKTAAIYGIAPAAELAIIEKDIADINAAFPGILPAGLKFSYERVKLSGSKEKTDHIVYTVKDKKSGTYESPDENYPDGSPYLEFLGGAHYEFSAEGVYALHCALWNRAKTEKPEKFYFGSTGFAAQNLSLSQDSGIVTMPPSGNSDFDALVATLKTASADDVTSISITGYATAVGEKVTKDKKVYTIVSDEYAKANASSTTKMKDKIALSDCLDVEKDKLKEGFQWGSTTDAHASGMPPSGDNIKAAKKQADDMIAYLRAQGIADDILKKIPATQNKGGLSKSSAQVQVSYKAAEDYKPTLADFPDVPAANKGSLAGLVTGELQNFFAQAKSIIGSTKKPNEKEKLILKEAADVEIALRQGFKDQAVAKSVAERIFTLLSTSTKRIAGADVLKAVLNASYGPFAPVTPPAPKAEDPAIAPPSAPAAPAEPKDKDKISYVKATPFVVGGTTDPTIVIKGDTSRIASVRSAWRNYPDGGKLKPKIEGQTLTITGLAAYAGEVRQRMLAENSSASADEQAKLGYGTYDITVVYKDGSSERIHFEGTK